MLQHQDDLPVYHQLDTDLIRASGRIDRDKRWNVFMLFCFKERPEHNRALAPKTTELIEKIPNLCQAFFSILDPGKSIPAHFAPTRSYIRYHLCLKASKTNAPRIRVKDTIYQWKEGESVMFDDSWEHEVMNDSDEIRVVLLVDVMRPMAWPGHLANMLMYWIARQHYGKRILKTANQYQIKAIN